MEIRKTKARITSVRLLVAGAIGLTLYFAHIAFIPVALALLISLVLSGPVETLHERHVPRSLSAALIVAAILGIMVALVNIMSEPAQKWFAAAPHTVRLIERKIRPFELIMQRIGELRISAGNIGSGPQPQQAASPAPPSDAPQESAPALLLVGARTVVLSCVTIVILTLFLLSGGPPMLARMTSAFASDLKSAHILNVIEKVRREVGRFYVTTALINVGLGIATSLAMMLCGMPNPFLWGTMAAILNFIPYAGPTVTLLVLTVVAIISFNGLGHAAAVAGSYLALATVEGQFVQPLLVGRRLQLNPMLVFLALWFGGFFWGIAGIILATPALAALKVVATNSAGGEQLLDFLSPHHDDDHLVHLPRNESGNKEADAPLAGALRRRGPLPPAL
ncbi:MAG TPA: AI-2E family transporter [Steroidobacteraceae bacterium]|nr:AI-2E family transporter [Steroidobacteraceae bacterium]